MGLLKSIQDAVYALIDPANTRQKADLPVLARQEYSPHQQVVGESFRSENFLALMRAMGAEPDSTHETVARLELDPGNSHAPTGKAVKVFSGGYLLGFIPNTEAEVFFDKIGERGEAALAACEIWFDDPQQEKPRHSARIIVDFPVRFNDEPDPMEGLRNFYYEGLSKKTQELIDRNREIKRHEKPINLPVLKRGSEIYWSRKDPHDDDLFLHYLEKGGIRIGLSKSRTELAVVDSRDQVDSTTSMDKVLAWDKPIITFEEFLTAYPQLLPPKEKMIARSKALSGIYKGLVRWDTGELRDKVTNKASWKPDLYQGAAYSPWRMLDIGLHKCVNTRDYQENLQNIFQSVGGEVFDAIVVKGKLGIDEGDGRIFVSVQDRRICDVAKNDEEDLKSSVLYNEHNNVITQINWIEKNKFLVNISFLYL
jgi:hypothetical protein